MTDKARSQATVDRLKRQLRELKRKGGLYKTRLKVAQLEIAQLEIAQLKKSIQDIDDQSQLSLSSPSDCIFRNLVNNRQVPMNRHRYLIEALTWGRMTDDTSPAALETIRNMLPLPSERLLCTKFAEQRGMISNALQNEAEMWRLIQLWESANPYSAQDRRIILAVDAVSFQPMVTVSENGFLTGIEDMERLEDVNLFPVPYQPCYLREISRVRLAQRLYCIFILYLQPINPNLSCAIVYVVAATSRKGNVDVVEKLLGLKSVPESRYALDVISFAFEGNSCFEELYLRTSADLCS
jgi:hypothetical protein